MGLGGEKKGGVKNTQQKVLFDVYLRVDYRQRGNMELGPFEVGKHWKKKGNTKCHSSHPNRLFARLLLSDVHFSKAGGLGGVIRRSRCKLQAITLRWRRSETSPSLTASGPSDAA